MPYVYGDGNMVHDAVPLDTVVDAILGAATCIEFLGAKSESYSVPIVNCGTSSKRALTLFDVARSVEEYWSKYPSRRKQMSNVIRPNVTLSQTAFLMQIQYLRFKGCVLSKFCGKRHNDIGKRVSKCAD